MKTTLDLPDDLLIEAKAVAARRRTSLKAIIEHALRREVAPPPNSDEVDFDRFEVGPHGILRLKPRGAKITSELIYQMMDEEGI